MVYPRALSALCDFLLGYAENTAVSSIAASVMASAPNLTDAQMIAGSLLIFFGIFPEGLFKAFSEELTPFPRRARWFSVPFGAIPALVISMILGPNSAIGAAVGTMFLSFGSAFMFGGLLAVMPDRETFEKFERKLALGTRDE